MNEPEASAAAPPPTAPPADPPPTAAERFQEAISQVDRQEEPERELWRGGYSPKAMIGAWLLSGVFTLSLLVAGILLKSGATVWMILLVLIILPWIYYGLLLAYRRMSVRYLLTSQRFIHELGILRRVIDRIEVIDMDDITFEQNLLDRLLGVGTIRINSSDRSHPVLVLRGIENVREVSNIFDDIRRSERRRRGLHIESI